MSLMSPFELKIKLDLAEDRAKFVKEHSLSDKMNAIVTDDGYMHFFDDEGNDITKSVESIEYDAFNPYPSLTSIIIPDSVKSIGDYAFSYCTRLTSIVIPDSVESIGLGAFSYCTRLTSIVIPDSVKSIRGSAFYNCSSLTSISIPDSVRSIGYSAFFLCRSLKSIVFKGNTLKEVRSMHYYPWGVEDKSVFKVEKQHESDEPI